MDVVMMLCVGNGNVLTTSNLPMLTVHPSGVPIVKIKVLWAVHCFS